MKFYVIRYTGFSLVELMIVVAIIGILAAVAIPSYNSYVQDGRRGEGQSFASDLANRQERHFTTFNQYAANVTGAGDTSLGLPNNQSASGAYTAVITALGDTPTSYTITVTPVIADARCGSLILDNVGRRNVSTSNDADIISECWR